MSQIAVHAKFSFKPDQLEEGLALLKGLLEPGRSDPGCIYYDMLQDPQDKNTFYFIERWENQASLDEHMKNPALANAMVKAPGLLAGAPEVTFMSYVA